METQQTNKQTDEQESERKAATTSARQANANSLILPPNSPLQSSARRWTNSVSCLLWNVNYVTLLLFLACTRSLVNCFRCSRANERQTDRQIERRGRQKRIRKHKNTPQLNERHNPLLLLLLLPAPLTSATTTKTKTTTTAHRSAKPSQTKHRTNVVSQLNRGRCRSVTGSFDGWLCVWAGITYKRTRKSRIPKSRKRAWGRCVLLAFIHLGDAIIVTTQRPNSEAQQRCHREEWARRKGEGEEVCEAHFWATLLQSFRHTHLRRSLAQIIDAIVISLFVCFALCHQRKLLWHTYELERKFYHSTPEHVSHSATNKPTHL